MGRITLSGVRWEAPEILSNTKPAIAEVELLKMVNRRLKCQQSLGLDSCGSNSNIMSMRDNLPAKKPSNLPAQIPSLARAFETSRQALQQGLNADQSTAQIVTQTRRALDKAGAEFQSQTDDPNIQKAGLWLIEMVKAGDH